MPPGPKPVHVSSGPPQAKPPSINSGRDARAFLDYVCKEGKPGLISFMNNCYNARSEGDDVTFFFDRRHANLIPMLKNPGQSAQLRELAQAFYKRHMHFHYFVGDDPEVVAAKKAQEVALTTAKANPVVKWLLDNFKSRIVNVEIMSDQTESSEKEKE